MPLGGDTAFQAESGVHFPISTGRDKFRHLSRPFDTLQRRPRRNSVFILFESGEEVLGIAVASKSGVRQARYWDRIPDGCRSVFLIVAPLELNPIKIASESISVIV